MTMPSQCSHLLLILLLIATTHTMLAAVAEQRPITLAGCPDKCGNISIPFPFGMKVGCFLEGFEVTCNYSFNPPRAFLSENSILHQVGDANYTTWDLSDSGTTNYAAVMNRSFVPAELIDISASKSELRAYGAIRSDCLIDGPNSKRHLVKLQGTNLGKFGGLRPFLLSSLLNVLIGVGWNVQPKMVNGNSIDTTTGYMLGCLSYIRYNVLTNGSCSGRGCCEASIPPEKDVGFPISGFSVAFEPQKQMTNPMSYDSPCSYGMIVESSWYNFSSEDMFGFMALPNKYPKGVPFVLDFAIRNRSCPAEGQQTPQDYACISGNSYCAKAPSGDGYVCRCQDNYDGNPYITNGCQDINECDLHANICSAGSICKNTPGGYECPCKAGMRGNGKEGNCTEKFPLAAKVTAGISSSIVVVVLMAMVNQLLKLNKFYELNGGPILKGIKNIRIYTRKQLKQITGNYKHPIGEGAFGKVYMGNLEDKRQVAIKMSIKVEKERTKEFTDEVIIQSEMRHKNIVRLLGCCLEVDVPMLVYEFVPRGSLYEVLFRGGDSIPVNTRLGIAVGSAEGLTYMHSAGVSTIRHGDVKSANILLDENFSPKVSDFGTSSLMARGIDEMTEQVIGDKSYIDPIYMQEGIVTQKSDVYSFGVVLIELVTRRPATYDKERSYIKNFVQACLDKRAREFFDNDITSDEDIKILEMVSGVAVECLKTNPEERLDMRQVESSLFYINGQSVHGQERNNLGNLSPSPDDVALLTGGEKDDVTLLTGGKKASTVFDGLPKRLTFSLPKHFTFRNRDT